MNTFTPQAIWDELVKAREEQQEAERNLRQAKVRMERADEHEAALSTLYKLATGSLPPECEQGHERIMAVIKPVMPA